MTLRRAARVAGIVVLTVLMGGCRWFAWGAVDYGQLGNGTTSPQAAPTGTPTTMHWSSVDAGYAFSCGVRTNRAAFCWGSNSVGQLGNIALGAVVTGPVALPNDGTNPWTKVSAGGGHACGIRANGLLLCWGYNGFGQIGSEPPSPGPYRPIAVAEGITDVSAGAVHTCAVSAGQLLCWGSNESGQLGSGSGQIATSPIRIGTASDWTAVRAGSGHTCGIRAAGQLWCWGENLNGAFGNGTLDDSPTPIRIGTANDWASVDTWGGHSCGIRAGQLFSAGLNADGQVGDGTTTPRLGFTRIGTATDWTSVSVGVRHSCGTRGAGALWCWGDGAIGALGTGDNGDRTVPARVGGGTDWLVDAGYEHTCGVRKDRADVQCFGDNALGSLGDRTTVRRFSPVFAGMPPDWTDMVAGRNQTCGVSADGGLWCWGENAAGQVGNNAAGSSVPAPVRVSAANDWTDVAAGSYHSCAIRVNSTLWCWGRNLEGQIGDATTTQRNVATQVAGGPWIAVSAGHVHTCAIKGASASASVGTLWCWGFNGGGRLGDGTTTQRLTPVQVGADADWSKVSAGAFHTCGMRGSALYCWGANSDGQLGLGRDGTPGGRTTPGLVAGGGTGWTQVAAGNNHTCGLNAGSLYCWGQNTYGQVGDGGGLNRTSPSRLGSATDWGAVGAGNYHSCAVRASALSCWGWNASGQVGDGTTTNRVAPVPVGSATDWVQVDGGYAHTVGSRNAPPDIEQ